MSLHKEVDGDGVAVPGTIQSGAFTADVTLTGEFRGHPDARRLHQLRRQRSRPGLEGHASARTAFDTNGATLDSTARRQPRPMTVCGRRLRTALTVHARRASSAASTPTSRTGMLPERSPPGNSTNRNGVQNPVSSEGRPFAPPFFFPTVWQWTSRDAQNVLGGGFGLEALECLMSFQ